MEQMVQLIILLNILYQQVQIKVYFMLKDQLQVGMHQLELLVLLLQEVQLGQIIILLQISNYGQTMQTQQSPAVQPQLQVVLDPHNLSEITIMVIYLPINTYLLMFQAQFQNQEI